MIETETKQNNNNKNSDNNIKKKYNEISYLLKRAASSSMNDGNHNNQSTVTLSNAVTTTAQDIDRHDAKERERLLDLKHESVGGYFRHESDNTMSESSLTSDNITFTGISELSLWTLKVMTHPNIKHMPPKCVFHSKTNNTITLLQKNKCIFSNSGKATRTFRLTSPVSINNKESIPLEISTNTDTSSSIGKS
ncbi:hypothetical protein RFI_29252 [Reticulomyxa filosa]|uniref:Uncharacterized protein n=1 Tax=Reticulomyxa filosa TaxID=46433 RepID=X6M3U2_RETFI|nr:hypothetical protein RFI_29252 [Reticulomyxa filosa]|eukprot:ETO08137.1 hypothetical protein RFI_29252 [Reticulomyxa filosa]